jgi:hypothetical protein
MLVEQCDDVSRYAFRREQTAPADGHVSGQQVR